MARQPGFIASGIYVFHPHLTKKQLKHLKRAKRALDRLRYKFNVPISKDTRECEAAISSLTVWFSEPTGYWTTPEGVPLKARTCHVDVWFMGVSWRATFDMLAGNVSKTFTYTVRWEELESRDPVPAKERSAGKSRIRERKRLQRKLKRGQRKSKHTSKNRRKDR